VGDAAAADLSSSNLLTGGDFEVYVPPQLGSRGWVSDVIRQTPAKSETYQPRSGAKNGACWTPTYLDCGIYQEITAPGTGQYSLQIHAAADRSGGFVGANVNGAAAASADVQPGPFGVYRLYPLSFNARAGDVIRVWMYSPASPGYVVIDDVSLTVGGNPPPSQPVDCVQGDWRIVSQAVSYSEWVTRGAYQERQRTTTIQWARDTIVEAANGGVACGPSTQTTTETITETQPPPAAVPPIPELSAWERRMIDFGSQHCNQGAIAAAIGSGGLQTEDNVWYYDGTKVYQQIAGYTKNPAWYTCAGYTNNAYRSWVLALTSGLTSPTSNLGAWRVFPHGLANDYRRTGDATSRNAAVALSRYAAFADWGGSAECGLSRETAYILNAYVVAEELGEPRHPLLMTAVDNALAHLRQSFETNSCTWVVPFMMGLTMESLIHYYELTSDPRIPPAIERAADAMWTGMWLAESEGFAYYTGLAAAPDLNMLIAPAYAWLWQLTGAPRHLERGDAIFAGGVRRAWLGAGKAFSQNYRWSFDYVKWRSQPAGSLQPPTRY
jgi:hypothetical protein